ncbi:NAD(P)-dependent oxidoreductase [Imhoffiella purpurea]|uniref:Flavin reductase n=1 Tax=Imhoffiella purpurea TaxID=1249627 RepID=W9VS74_9GAMM|nr:NAD(P)H-binding protein [Imhoffiella purpurea]EXJ13265.1 Flavin reductase [Imhoffiella purpurea]
MKVVVFGATGKTGRTVALNLLAAGHEVTAFARDPAKFSKHTYEGLRILQGDALNPADVASAVAGQDAVVVSLGDSLNPVVLKLGARLGVKRNTPPNICEAGTANILAAMRTASVKRMICVTSYGVGETRDRLSRAFKVWFRVLQLGEQLADKDRQETLVKASDLDWTLVQPVGLTDGAATGRWVESTSGDRRKRTVSRVDLADFIKNVLEDGRYVRETVVLSQLTISERDFATQAA